MKYYRRFITLMQERAGYAMPGRHAAGRIVIEARELVARAALYVQDISPKCGYRLIFIKKGSQGNIGADLGAVIADEKGRYEGKFEFDRRNIGGSGLTCEDIDACAIIAAESPEDLTAALVGYREQPFSWRVGLSFSSSAEKMPDDKKAPGPEKSPGSEKLPDSEKLHADESPGSEKLPGSERTLPMGEEALPGEIKTKQIKTSQIMPEYTLAEEVPPCVYGGVAAAELWPNSMPCKIAALFEQEENLAEFSPFGGHGVQSFEKWIVTTLPALRELNQIERDLMQNAHIQACYSRHKHVLLGMADNGYILAVPDIYDSGHIDKIREFSNLFDSFKLCLPDVDNQMEGRHGYWLKSF